MSTHKKTITVTFDEPTKSGGNVLDAGTYRLLVPSDYDSDPASYTGEDVLHDGSIRCLRDPMVIMTDVTPNFADIAKITCEADAWDDLEDHGDTAQLYELGSIDVEEGQRVRIGMLGDRVSLANL